MLKQGAPGVFVSTSMMLLPEALSVVSSSGLPLQEFTIKLKFGLWAGRSPREQLAHHTRSVLAPKLVRDGVERELPFQGISTQEHTAIFSLFSQDWMLRVLSWDKGQKINKKLNK